MTTYTKTITSDAYIRGVVTITSNSKIKKLGASKTINTNLHVKSIYGGKPLSTAYSTLVSLYRMNEPSWSGVPGEVADEKGDNSGSAMGDADTTENGLFSKAGIFSGTDTGVNCGNDTTFQTNHISVNIWVYPTAATNSYNDIINSGRYRVILRASKYIEFWAYSLEAGWIQAVSNVAVTLNKWTLITCTYNGTARLYINGVLQTVTGTGGGNLAWAGNTIYIAQSGGNTNEFTGKLDDVGFWNAALTQSEITNIWKEFTFLFTSSNIKVLANTKTLNSKSFIKKLAATKTIASNSKIKKLGTSKTLISNAKIARKGVTITVNSNARIEEIQSATLNSNSNIKKATNKTLNSNAKIKKPGTEGALNSNSYIKKLAAVNTLNSNSYISKSQSNILTSNSYVIKGGTKTLNSNSFIKTLGNIKTLTSKSFIRKTATQVTLSSAMVIKTVTTTPIYTNSFILKIYSNNLNSNLYITKTYSKSLTSDSYIKKIDNLKTITSSSFIIKLGTNTINSNYIIKTLESGSIASTYIIKKLSIPKTLTSDCVVKLGGVKLLLCDYTVMEYGEWSEEWEVEIVIPKTVTINSNSKIKKLANTKTIISKSYIKRPAYEGGLISNSRIKQAYIKVINSIYYIRRTDTTKPYVYTALYINKPVILSANMLSYTENMI